MLPLEGRTRAVTFVFIALLLITGAAVVSNVAMLQFLSDLVAGKALDTDRANALDAQQSVIAILQLVAFLASAVVFLAWFHRAHANLSGGGLSKLQYRPGWAIGGFFVPVFNLVVPYQVMQEVWRGSSLLSRNPGAVRDTDLANPSCPPGTPLVGWWWGLFLLSSVIGNASAGLLLPAEELDQFVLATTATLASDLAELPAAVLALLVVRRVTRMQERARLSRSLGSAPATPIAVVRA